jgi:hypothetical protein
MESPSSQPPLVGPEFLEWLRTVTETRWETHIPRDFQAAGVGGLDWARGTKWRGGMTDAQVDDAQRRYRLVFPPDYRRFLTTLHTTDPEMVGAFYEGSTLVAKTGRSVHDWSGDPDPINKALAAPVDGLLWSIEAEDSWHPRWGPRPDTERGRVEVIRALAANAPPLIPVMGHRYLVGAPIVEGNPVLSMYGADVIVYADNLESYLASELAGQPWHVSKHGELADALGIWWDLIEGA